MEKHTNLILVKLANKQLNMLLKDIINGGFK